MSNDLASFHQYLCSSRRILALVGAGLSASSGLPTFRGAGGLWKGYEATELATPDAFQTDPGLVWQFYSHRRLAALRAKPNNGHYALAELAKTCGSKRFLTLTQNVDGLSQRAGHPADGLLHLHGDLFTVKCTEFMCSYTQENNYDKELSRGLAHIDETTQLKRNIPVEELPICPRCKVGLLRPGVVWFGEALPLKVMSKADEFITSGEVDLILVIGTSGSVWPAAGYIEQVVMRGGKVAIFNIESMQDYEEVNGWIFNGDAAEWLPKALEPLIGKIGTHKV